MKAFSDLAWELLGKSISRLNLGGANAGSDLGVAFPDGQLASFFNVPYIDKITRDTRGSKEFTDRTRDAARWARQVVKNQTSKHQGNIMNPS
jgi:hypothetical protein